MQDFTTRTRGAITRARLVAATVSAAGLIQVTPASAQDGIPSPTTPDRPELALGIFEHGANFHPLGSKLVFDLPELPAGQVYDGFEENGTVDVQIAYRTAPLPLPLKPRLAGKLQVSTAGRTSFASVGAEWRQHVLRGRVYGQIGIGITLHDGYRFTPDPFEAGLTRDEALRRYAVYQRRTAFGSQILFNPNAAIGLRLNPRWAIEVAWEHHSHHQLFSDRNPGIDHVGLRVVRALGR